MEDVINFSRDMNQNVRKCPIS